MNTTDRITALERSNRHLRTAVFALAGVLGVGLLGGAQAIKAVSASLYELHDGKAVAMYWTGEIE